MKTYTELKGLSKINWHNVLDQLIADPINWTLHMIARHESGRWVTCAVGNMCEIIPRNKKGKPKDKILLSLGIDFFSQIHEGEFVEAKKTLACIEQRSSELIEKILNRQSSGSAENQNQSL